MKWLKRNVFFISLCSLVWKFCSGSQHAWRNCENALQRHRNLGPTHQPQPPCNNSNSSTEQRIPDNFVMHHTRHRDVRSLQKNQCPETSTKIEFSKAFDSRGISFVDSFVDQWIWPGCQVHIKGRLIS